MKLSIYEVHIFELRNEEIMTSSQLACQFNWLERCTGIAEVRVRIPASLIFSGFLFATAQVALITARIFFTFICFFFVILKLGVMLLSVLYCGTPYRQLIPCCSNENIIFFIHEALGNNLSYRYIVTNLSFLNIVINPSFLRLFEYIRLRLSLKYKYYGVSLGL